MADVDVIVRKAKTRAQVTEREQKSTAKLAAEAQTESRNARAAYKKARKAFKKANRIARKARKAAEEARKHLSKVSRRAKKSASRVDKPDAADDASAAPVVNKSSTKRSAKSKTTPRAPIAPPKRVKRRAPRRSRDVVTREEPEPIHEPETFEMSESDLVREQP